MGTLRGAVASAVPSGPNGEIDSRAGELGKETPVAPLLSTRRMLPHMIGCTPRYGLGKPVFARDSLDAKPIRCPSREGRPLRSLDELAVAR